jgi:hypothetical protein
VYRLGDRRSRTWRPQLQRSVRPMHVVVHRFTSSLPSDQSATADFSRASCETRIRAGYDDAVAQGIGNPRAPGLRLGATAAREDAAPRR